MLRRLCKTLSLPMMAITLLLAPAAQAQEKKQLSNKAVSAIMGLTWTIMPDKIKGAEGKDIKILKQDKKQIEIPLNDARRVIMAARLSAQAQICKLPKLQKDNYRVMMKRELDSKKWSRRQVVFINQLHLFTVMWLNDNVIIQTEDTKEHVAGSKSKKTCSDQQRAQVKALIENYIKTASK